MKLTEVAVPLRNTKFAFPFPRNSHLLFFSSSSSSFLKPSHVKPFSSIRSTTDNSTTTTTTTTTSNTSSSSPWLNNWSSSPPNPSIKPESGKRSEIRHSSEPAAGGGGSTRTTAIDRIVLRLRNLGLGSDDDEEEVENEYATTSEMALTGEEKLGDLLRRDWVRPDRMLVEDDEEDTVLPWEREQEGNAEEGREIGGVKKRTMKAPTLAELTLEDAELRRLRTLGTTIRERISIPKAGITGPVLEKIHDQWRKSELVRLKFHEVLARDMRTAHEIVQVG